MRKSISVILLLALTTVVYGQDSDFDMPDSLAVVKLEYETLDSAAITALLPLTNIHFPNIVCYPSEDGIKIAYYTVDRNKWTAFLLPFSQWTNDFNLVNLDQKGQPELVVKGVIADYGSHGGSGLELMFIINIDSIPTQIFKVSYGCWEEMFGDINTNGWIKGYDRKIRITDNSIIIGSLDKKYQPFHWCGLTEIPGGTYMMDAGQIKKVKYVEAHNRRKKKR
ncbi:hypothetical protein [Fluviicola sp.]|jgi:hypothetical protein|uniref:hypothetical protein n=1 Tax=Fluviicola sp. TaxID=1917219 RepID=UPI00281CBF5B|nr:hypothetical protein [Fluviicola sp.]MDR0800941.1 hypothetical protein [Fluviicola sp.]